MCKQSEIEIFGRMAVSRSGLSPLEMVILLGAGIITVAEVTEAAETCLTEQIYPDATALYLSYLLQTIATAYTTVVHKTIHAPSQNAILGETRRLLAAQPL